MMRQIRHRATLEGRRWEEYPAGLAHVNMIRRQLGGWLEELQRRYGR